MPFILPSSSNPNNATVHPPHPHRHIPTHHPPQPPIALPGLPFNANDDQQGQHPQTYQPHPHHRPSPSTQDLLSKKTIKIPPSLPHLPPQPRYSAGNIHQLPSSMPQPKGSTSLPSSPKLPTHRLRGSNTNTNSDSKNNQNRACLSKSIENIHPVVKPSSPSTPPLNTPPSNTPSSSVPPAMKVHMKNRNNRSNSLPTYLPELPVSPILPPTLTAPTIPRRKKDELPHRPPPQIIPSFVSFFLQKKLISPKSLKLTSPAILSWKKYDLPHRPPPQIYSK
eukprot:Pgem_evm1s6050